MTTEPAASSQCRDCGKLILWGETLDGKRIPLDMRPPIFRIIRTQNGLVTLVERMENAGVSHFATCPRANDFSSAKR